MKRIHEHMQAWTPPIAGTCTYTRFSPIGAGIESSHAMMLAMMQSGVPSSVCLSEQNLVDLIASGKHATLVTQCTCIHPATLFFRRAHENLFSLFSIPKHILPAYLPVQHRIY